MQYEANKNKMRQLLGHVSQIKFEKKASNLGEALVIVKRENPDSLKMHGVDKRLLLNPDWQLYDAATTNEVAVVTEVAVLYYGTNCYVAVRFDLTTVAMDKPPVWVNRTNNQ